MAIPYNHRFTHTPIFIFAGDDAWDSVRIEAEQTKIAERQAALALEQVDASTPVPPPLPWQSWSEHPVSRYREGLSRFDIETVRDYLLPDKSPTLVKLRRMTHPQWVELQTMFESERTIREPVVDDAGQQITRLDGSPIIAASSVVGRLKTLMFALRMVVVECGDLGVKAGARGLTDEQCDALRDQLGNDQFLALAYACLAATRALTPDESFT